MQVTYNQVRLKKKKTMGSFERILIVNCTIKYGRRENVEKRVLRLGDRKTQTTCPEFNKKFYSNLLKILLKSGNI